MSRTSAVPLRGPNQLCIPKIHLSAYSNPELKRHTVDLKKAQKKPILVCENVLF